MKELGEGSGNLVECLKIPTEGQPKSGSRWWFMGGFRGVRWSEGERFRENLERSGMKREKEREEMRVLQGTRFYTPFVCCLMKDVWSPDGHAMRIC